MTVWIGYLKAVQSIVRILERLAKSRAAAGELAGKCNRRGSGRVQRPFGREGAASMRCIRFRWRCSINCWMTRYCGADAGASHQPNQSADSNLGAAPYTA
jgi:hypothetical protein